MLLMAQEIWGDLISEGLTMPFVYSEFFCMLVMFANGSWEFA